MGHAQYPSYLYVIFGKASCFFERKSWSEICQRNSFSSLLVSPFETFRHSIKNSDNNSDENSVENSDENSDESSYKNSDENSDKNSNKNSDKNTGRILGADSLH